MRHSLLPVNDVVKESPTARRSVILPFQRWHLIHASHDDYEGIHEPHRDIFGIDILVKINRSSLLTT